MLVKPDIPDEQIIACLEAEYGLRITQFALLPLGGDQCSAVYRAIAEDGAMYLALTSQSVKNGMAVSFYGSQAWAL